MAGWLWLAATFLLWALFHSVTAARPFKRWMQGVLGERAYAGLYRLVYNVVAVLTFVPVLYVLAVYVPATVIWRAPFPWAWVMLLIQALGVLGLLISLLQTDALSFLGLRQAWRYLRGAQAPQPPGALVTGGPYALVRHPLYLFSLLALWFTPLLTLNLLIFNLLATLYFWLGSLHEERRLLAEFGDVYRQYQMKVPALLPWPRPS
jgi:protein-S-isoprenylcysteine O-methyltransferase Ste14